MTYNIIGQLGGLFKFLRRYGVTVEDIIRGLGYLTTTPGITNPIYSKPKLYKTKPKAYEEKRFNFKHNDMLNMLNLQSFNNTIKTNILFKDSNKRLYNINTYSRYGDKNVNYIKFFINNSYINTESMSFLDRIYDKKIYSFNILTGLKDKINSKILLLFNLFVGKNEKISVNYNFNQVKTVESVENQMDYIRYLDDLDDLMILEELNDIRQ